MSNWPIQLIDFVLYGFRKGFPSWHHSTLAQMIRAQAFQKSLPLIEETPERFDSAVGDFDQRHRAVELLQVPRDSALDDRHCVILAVIGAIDGARVKLLTNPSDLRLEFLGTRELLFDFLDRPGKYQELHWQLLGSAMPGSMLRSVNRDQLNARSDREREQWLHISRGRGPTE